MNAINNLSYTLEINFVNKSGVNSTISIKYQDNGLKVKTVKIGNICITEETINGRVLSGRIDNSEGYCGYRYDYQNGENLININPKVPIETAISLINKSKKQPDFLTSELVFSSVVRNDYRVVILNSGDINIVKTVSAENENSQHCRLQETINLTKSKGDEVFIEQDKRRVCTINDKHINETQLSELAEILGQNPQSCKNLIQIRNQIKQNYIINQEKTL